MGHALLTYFVSFLFISESTKKFRTKVIDIFLDLILLIIKK